MIRLFNFIRNQIGENSFRRLAFECLLLWIIFSHPETFVDVVTFVGSIVALFFRPVRDTLCKVLVIICVCSFLYGNICRVPITNEQGEKVQLCDPQAFDWAWERYGDAWADLFDRIAGKFKGSRSPYVVLGLPESATQEQILTRWSHLYRKFDPSNFREEQREKARKVSKEIIQASLKALFDASKRKEDPSRRSSYARQVISCPGRFPHFCRRSYVE